MMLLTVPLTAAGTRVSSFAASVGVGFAVGFAYFFLVAFTRPLGQTGSLPPALAAWAANAIFALVGGFYLLRGEEGGPRREAPRWPAGAGGRRGTAPAVGGRTRAAAGPPAWARPQPRR